MRVAACLLCALWLIVPLAGCDAGAPTSEERVRLLVTPVDTPTATPLAAPTAEPTTYSVRPGDTLSGIAALFGVSVDDIVRTNNISDPNLLSEGQVLTIPARPGGSPVAEATGTPGPEATPSITGPALSPTLPPPDVTPPLGPTSVPGQGEGGESSAPGTTISPTAVP